MSAAAAIAAKAAANRSGGNPRASPRRARKVSAPAPALRCSRQSADSSTERGVLTALVATTQGLEIVPFFATFFIYKLSAFESTILVGDLDLLES